VTDIAIRSPNRMVRLYCLRSGEIGMCLCNVVTVVSLFVFPLPAIHMFQLEKYYVDFVKIFDVDIMTLEAI